LLPSSIMLFATARWINRHRDKPVVRAFKQGMSPIVISLLICSGWSLAATGMIIPFEWRLLLVTAVAVGLVVWGKVHMFWLLAIGGALGAFGLLSPG
jgi:chromate transporter